VRKRGGGGWAPRDVKDNASTRAKKLTVWISTSELGKTDRRKRIFVRKEARMQRGRDISLGQTFGPHSLNFGVKDHFGVNKLKKTDQTCRLLKIPRGIVGKSRRLVVIFAVARGSGLKKRSRRAQKDHTENTSIVIKLFDSSD